MNEENGTTTVEQLDEQVSSRASKTKSDKKKGKGKGKAAVAGKKSKTKSGGIKKVGIIHTIGEMISRSEGASTKEIVAQLAKKFPDRSVDGMTTTVRIQVTRIPKRYEFEMKKNKDEKRGLVYKAPANLVTRMEKADKE